MIEVTALVEEGTLAGNLISCKDIIGKEVIEISNQKLISIAFFDENNVPIADVEKVKIKAINAETGVETELEITNNGEFVNTRFIYVGTSHIRVNFGIQDNKLVMINREYTSTNVITDVDDVQILSMNFGGNYTTQITPTIN